MLIRILIILAVFRVATSKFICPRQCKCDGVAVVDCSNRGLTFISTDGFDIDTRKVILSNNSISSLGASVFHDTKVRMLQQVLLDHNRISHVDPEAFFGQVELVVVDLSYNALTELSLFPFRRCWRLQRLVLSHNPLHTFDGSCPPPSFRHLHIDHCALRYVLTEKEKVDSVAGMALLQLEGLQQLQIEGNPLRCDCRQVDTYRQLERLRLARDTNCGESPDLFWQAVLEKLDCSPCPQKCSCATHSVANCSSTSLQTVPRDGFNHSVTTIVLSNNSIERIDNGAFLAANVTATERILLDHNLVWLLDAGAFAGLDRLRHLDLSHNALPGLSEQMLANASLCGLETLLLSHNRLSHLAAGAFAGLSHLRHLDLSHNLLKILSADAFRGATATLVSISVATNKLPDLSWMVSASWSLREVDASDNLLETLSVAEVAALSRLGALKLAGNPLHCNASLLHALRQLEAGALARDTKCYNPPELRGQFWQNMEKHTAKLSAVAKAITLGEGKACPEIQDEPQNIEVQYHMEATISLTTVLIIVLVVIVILSLWKWNKRRSKQRSAKYQRSMTENKEDDGDAGFVALKRVSSKSSQLLTSS